MEKSVWATEVPEIRAIGTHDFAGSIELVKAIDRAMRHYFGADHWLAMRNRLLPGLRPKL